MNHLPTGFYIPSRLRGAMTAALLLSLSFIAIPSDAGRYELIKGKGVDVCEAYEKSLNSFQPKVPMVCGRPVSSKLGFDKPNWKQIDSFPNGAVIAETFWDFTEFLWQRDVNPVRYFRSDKWPQWKGTSTQYKEAYRAYRDNRERLLIDKPPLFAEFDIDNDGKRDRIYFEHPCGSVYGDLLAVLSSNYKTIDRQRTERLMPHPSFKRMGLGVFRPVKKGDWGIPPLFVERGFMPVEDAMSDAHYDVFLYKGITYIDQWWSSHPDFKGKSDTVAGRLRVYQPTPTGTVEICIYRFVYP